MDACIPGQKRTVEINGPQSKRFTVTFVWQRSAVAVEGETVATRIFNALKTCLCRCRRILKRQCASSASPSSSEKPIHLKKSPPREIPAAGLD